MKLAFQNKRYEIDIMLKQSVYFDLILIFSVEKELSEPVFLL